jgi:hypothetical protein
MCGGSDSAITVQDTSTEITENQFKIINEHPTNKCFNEVLDRYVEVFGIYVISHSSIPDKYILHSANILAQFIDNDADGQADDQNVLNFLQDNKFVIPVWTESLREKTFEDWDGECDAGFAASMYYDNDDWAFGGIESSGEWDTNLEEIWHIVSVGWYESYPKYFGDQRSILRGQSKLMNAVDAARGGYFEEIPSKYPDGAWYAYDDETCDYGCQIHEYFYWILMSNIGALDPSITDKCDDSQDEWFICTNEELKEKDVLAFELLNNYGFNLPTNIPNGSYEGLITVGDLSSSSKTPPMVQETTDNDFSDEDIKQVKDILDQFTIVQDVSYTDFTTYVDVGPLRVFKLQEASDTFLLKVASIISLMFLDNENIDTALQEEFFSVLRNEYVYQRVGYLGPEFYDLDSDSPLVSCCPEEEGGKYRDNQTDYIWDDGESTDRQLGTILEHSLHTITNIGFKLMSPDWDYTNPNSALRKAYQESVDNGSFNDESYPDVISIGEKAHYRLVTQEFFFWVIVTEWNYGYLWNIPNEEFRISSKEDLKNTLPLSHQLYIDFVEKILSPPNDALSRKIYEYTP